MDDKIDEGKSGSIKQIRVSYAGVVDAKASTGYLEMKLGSHSGPYRFAIGSGPGGATNTAQQHAEVIDVDIPVNGNETVEVEIELNEAAVNAHISITWEA